MDSRSRFIPIKLANGMEVKVQATILGSEQEVSAEKFSSFDFKGITSAVEGIAESFIGVLKTVKPDKATVQFGIEVGIESGKMTALLVKGTGNANLTIALEWNNQNVDSSE